MRWRYETLYRHEADVPSYRIWNDDGSLAMYCWRREDAACLVSLLNGCYDFSFTNDGVLSDAAKEEGAKALVMIKHAIDTALAALGKEEGDAITEPR